MITTTKPDYIHTHPTNHKMGYKEQLSLADVIEELASHIRQLREFSGNLHDDLVETILATRPPNTPPEYCASSKREGESQLLFRSRLVLEELSHRRQHARVISKEMTWAFRSMAQIQAIIHPPSGVPIRPSRDMPPAPGRTPSPPLEEGVRYYSFIRASHHYSKRHLTQIVHCRDMQSLPTAWL